MTSSSRKPGSPTTPTSSSSHDQHTQRILSKPTLSNKPPNETTPLLQSPLSPTINSTTSEGEPDLFAHEGETSYATEQVIVVDDDLRITITGYRTYWLWKLVFNIFSLLSLGVLFLLCRWFPTLEVKLTAIVCPLNVAQFVIVKNQWGQADIIPIQHEELYDISMDDVLPPKCIHKLDGGNLVSPIAEIPSPMASPQQSKATFITNRSNAIHNNSAEDGRTGEPPDMAEISTEPMVTELKYFDYRYIKFIFNTSTQDYQMSRYWRDKRWTSVSRALEGVDGAQLVRNRRKLFGVNSIVIEEKPTIRLLFDEVLHPFFVFQIASMILWSLDEYYYYAACIFLITVISTISTLVETKQAMKRLKDISKFSCIVRVWRGGTWWDIDSEELVPGDVFEVPSAAKMPTLPCDAILLDGDCIVNESMLTGESIPVSKTPVGDAELARLDFQYDDPTKSSRVSKFFLFSGTRIIRSRCGQRVGGLTSSDSDSALHFGTTQNEPNALALVARIGFNTTKVRRGTMCY
jgi:cation-transporting ATPase 13A3/4/5